MIHQIYITDSPSPIALEKVERIKANYEHKLWDNNSIRELLEKEFEPDVLWAYDELVPYSFKGDLAKYAIIYIYGGWYVDVSFSVLPDIDKYNDENGVFFKDTVDGYVACGMFYSPLGNEVLKKAIDTIVDNCKSRHYGIHPVDCTGPGVLGKVVNYSTKDYKGALMLINNTFCFVFGDTLIARGKKDGQHGSMSYLGDASGGNYRELWNDGKVYKSQLK
jgi:mannosyltransferase OCH1-like enzyme